MKFLEYPYVIITILVMAFLVMGVIGLYFTIKSVRTAKGSAEKSFCGIGKIENEFQKAGNMRKDRCLVYISVYLDYAERLYSESKAMRVLERIRKVLLTQFALEMDGEISFYGKDNFVAVNLCDGEEITALIEKCNREISEVHAGQGTVNLTHVRFGYYCTSSTEVSFKTALSRAKQACSMAEDQDILYCRWDSSNGKEFERKIKIENNIQNEIENNRFFLEYQPILDAKTGGFVGAEVLSRLNSHSDGILTPNAFLSAVNNVGLNEKFDYYIFEKNCKWISNNKDQRAGYVYTINFSRQTLCDEKFSDNVIEIVEQYGLNYNCLAVEVLEDKNLTKEEREIITKNLTILKEKGILILLDDFGKGYTSFSDMANFDISIVKIDKDITQNATNKTGLLILKNIIRTARELGFMTLCEGVETEEQKKIAVEAGCDMLQGYYFYRPMPVSRLEELFDKGSVN